MADVREHARAHEALDHAGHVDIDQGARLAVLKKQDRVGNVLAHSRNLCQLSGVIWETPGAGRCILGK
ncbi:hypothetical protein AVO45_02995 [Ruegeria marisrubri]|uniref:Uncharacterized protein n=1 Tax=Ruegeria marisrubri TaxID=1685379 RepID=A0A101CYZ3_9RHOB|nr:hypothetical protein AVO45_02995 [Ruegeria marisrubri]